MDACGVREKVGGGGGGGEDSNALILNLFLKWKCQKKNGLLAPQGLNQPTHSLRISN